MSEHDHPAPLFFHAAVHGGGVAVRGARCALLGHSSSAARGEAPDGAFAGWEWEGERLRAFNDRYGFQSLYYAADANSVAVSPSPLALLALGVSSAPDARALSVFLRLGFFIGDDTPFAAIRAVPPGAALEWSLGRLRVMGHTPRPPIRRCTRDQAVDGFVELFRQAVARRLPRAPYVLPLSGGRDSRHLLLELCRQGAPPALCVTGRKFPPDTGGDVRVARLLAASVGIAQRVVPRPRSRLAAEAEAALRLGMTTLEGAWYLPVAQLLRERTRETYDGIAGDVLSQSRSLEPGAMVLYRDGCFAELADQLLAARTDAWLREILGPDGMREYDRKEATAHLAAELERHADAACPLAAFHFWNRTRRSVAPATFTLAGPGVTVHAPYLDHELFDFLASLPDELVADRRLHTDAIQRTYPEQRHVPYAADSRHGPSFFAHRAAYLAGVALRVVRDPAWRAATHGAFPRLLRRMRPRAINRGVPLLAYLARLEAVRAGRGLPALPQGDPEFVPARVLVSA